MHAHQFAAALATAAAIASGSAARAQIPDDIAAKVAALGRVVDPEKTGAIYAPLHEKEPYSGVKVARDIAYGPDPRNLLDIFTPETVGAPRPAFMFVHGGGMTSGNKRPPGSAFYDNIMLWAAKNGMVGVNVEYRLAPQHVWPSGKQDLAAAIRYVHDNAARLGVDASRVFLMGHSAGATHVGSYLANPQFHGPMGVGIVGAILSSGGYDFSQPGQNEGRVAYFGPDPKLMAERSSVAGLIKSAVPLMINAAELDPPEILSQSVQLVEALTKAARPNVRHVFLKKHSHMSESYAINTGDRELSDQILEFTRKPK
jgi:triacylglycerol lipase